jgi:hypothetical protein
MIRKRFELLYRVKQSRRGFLHIPLRSCGALEQIGPTHLSDENEVSGQSANRIFASREVGYQKTHVLRGVSWRV